MDKYQIDGQKMSLHPRRVVEIMDAHNDWTRAKRVYPLYVEISPVGACNHRCTFCSVDYIGYKTNRLQLETLQRLLPEMGLLGIKSIMYAGEGEPLLHKEISQIIEITKSSGIDVSITSNGTIIPPRFLEIGLPNTEWIKFSINGGDEDAYTTIHNAKHGDFNKVFRNIETMVKYRQKERLTVTLGAQCLLLPENVKTIKQLVEKCKDVGLDYLVIKPYSQHLMSLNKIYSSLKYEDQLELAEELSAYNDEKFNVVFRAHTMRKYSEPQPYDKCRSTPFAWAYIMADGAVYSCSAYLLNDQFKLGNILESSFQEIWESTRRQANFEYVTKELNISKCRKNCRMDEVNRYLSSVIDHAPKHKNFI